MKQFAAVAFIAVAGMLASGCATKKYVRNTTAPIQSKVDQVAQTTTTQGQAIEESKTRINTVDQNAQSGISAAKEQAMTAQNRANDAMNKANEGVDMANRNSQEIANVRSSLQNVVANLDDYKMQNEVSIPFRFNKYTLTQNDKADLDKLVGDLGKYKRYFIAVEGYTDRTGSRQYNEELSRRRADAVTEYLVAKHDVPIYRIHQIGLGPDKPADEGRGRAARAKNRRVEVKIFSADQATASILQPNGSNTSGTMQNNMPNQPAPAQTQR